MCIRNSFTKRQHELVAKEPIRLRLASVQAPVWLDTTEIHYRLLHDDPTRLRAYAQNRWIAPPAALLEQRWREALAKLGPNIRTGDTPIYQLDIVVDRFEQVFDSPHSAYAVIGLRAVLMRSNRIGPVVERHFTSRRACDPQVQGAINALAMLVDSTLEDVLRWVINVDGSATAD
jgi:cholesterol transport system auxiliary component